MKAYSKFSIKQLFDSELLRLLLLFAVTIYLVGPFLTNRFLGSYDAQWYYYLLVDFLAQIKAGIFPVYVGQTEFSFDGFPIVRSPYYFYLAGLIDLISFGKLDPLYIQHATVVFSALLAIYGTYFVLKQIKPGLNWGAVVLSILYITCPGVLCLIYMSDSYTSFTAIPYLPILFYGNVRGFQKNDTLSVMITGACLAMLWIAHAPIALWSTTFTLLFQVSNLLLKCRRSHQFLNLLKNYLLVWLIFISLSFFYFINVFSVGAESMVESTGFFVSQGFVRDAMQRILSVIPDVFLPLHSPPTRSSDLQLGYSLWVIFLVGILIAIKQADLILGLLLSAVLLLGLLLYPIPYLTEFLWSHLPRLFMITAAWPMLRFYPLMASLLVISGIMALKYIKDFRLISQRYIALSLITFSLISLAWNAYEINKVVGFGWKNQQEDRKFYLKTENLKTYVYSTATMPGVRLKTEAYYDPALENQLISWNPSESGFISNSAAAFSQCKPVDQSAQFGGYLNSYKSQYQMTSKGGEEEIIDDLIKVQLQPNQKYVLGFQFDNDHYRGTLFAKGNDFFRLYNVGPNISSDFLTTFPFWTTQSTPQTISFRFIGNCGSEHQTCNATFHSLCLGTYNIENLPIQVRSLMPYKASVTTPNSAILTNLETHRIFVNGYQAVVNGQPAPVLKSAGGMATIPLVPGTNSVEMTYVGTPLMKRASVASLIAWASFIIYGIIKLQHRPV